MGNNAITYILREYFSKLKYLHFTFIMEMAYGSKIGSIYVKYCLLKNTNYMKNANISWSDDKILMESRNMLEMVSTNCEGFDALGPRIEYLKSFRDNIGLRSVSSINFVIITGNAASSILNVISLRT